jgi:rhodanese-related sulfurtransferase
MDYEISVEDVKAKLDRKETFTLIDVREPWEFQTAHIDGANLLPMGDVPSRAHQELDPEDHIVVLCHHGVRSMNVTAWLRQQGFEKAQSMRGGIDAWSRSGGSQSPAILAPHRKAGSSPSALLRVGMTTNKN